MANYGGSEDFISVHYAPTGDVHDALVAATNNISQVIDNLEAVINGLLKSQWEGISADAWNKIQNGWNAYITKLQEDSGSNAGILHEMTGNYATTDNHLAAQWDNITPG